MTFSSWPFRHRLLVLFCALVLGGNGFAQDDLPTYADPPDAIEVPPPLSLPLEPAHGETLAFIGNSLGERFLYNGQFEAALHLRYPEARIRVRNLCHPGDTAGFRPHPSRVSQWAFPGAETFHPELQLHFGIGHYPTPDEWLHEVRADTILAFFGFNESFDGLDQVDRFRRELEAFVDHTLSKAYNGRTAPRLILVTPIAFEDRTETYDLPDGRLENERLAVYAAAVLQVAKAKSVGAIDLFTPTREWFQEGDQKWTLNGCHLSSAGYTRLAPVLMQALYGGAEPRSDADPARVKQAVEDRDWVWFHDYRMLNGVHAYGQRHKPFGDINYPEEVAKLREMTRLRDERIWALVQGELSLETDGTLPPVADETTRALTPVESNFLRPIEFLAEEQARRSFDLRDGFEINLFASEAQFPDLRSPVQLSFDNRGRLWVAVIPSYPHYRPGDARPNDKLLIFEDTTGDGRADRQTVYADGLNLPLGFELAPEGVYVSQQPHLCLLIDDDGDDRADRMEILLTGFDTHDTHHSISAFAADASGSIYLCEGRFLHSQVETPRGPERMTDGGVWRFDPKRYRLERYSQADYNNPWAVAFDEWDQGYISDASSGENFWALPLSARVPHGLEIPKVGEFAPRRARPTSGSEFVSSRHFPEALQGHFMICNSIGFLGVSLHRVWEEGSGFEGQHIGDLLSSKDPNFRPVDLEFAPDGSLHVVDWYNPLICHVQHSVRDPKRDREHGRIWRITYPERPLVSPPRVAGASLEVLLDNLKLPEYRARYATRRELRGRPTAEVLAAVRQWALALDRKDPDYERLLCEALWATWAHNRVDHGLLERCLHAHAHQARAAAVQVLRYAWDQFPDHENLLLRAANDPHPRVRLAAIVAASWLENPTGARVVLEALRHPLDRWMGPVTQMILETTLAPALERLKSDGGFDVATNPNAEAFLQGTFRFEPTPPSAADAVHGPTRELTESELESYRTGREVFLRDGHCATCHQPDGKGTPGIYPPLTALNNPWIAQEDERLIKVVLKGLWGPLVLDGRLFDPAQGVPPMPGYSEILSDKEVAGVINYVRLSFDNNLPLVHADQVREVRARVASRQDFYLVEEIMQEHPIHGWETWPKLESKVRNIYE